MTQYQVSTSGPKMPWYIASSFRSFRWDEGCVRKYSPFDAMRRYLLILGAQWLSGRVLDSRPKGRGFEPHRRHCVVVLEQDTFILA